ncbi:MAG: hypothetical protein UX94_C0003G0029 [Parcubacteria group bacterium GW2011_GWA2_47_21]|nr:MAG: hypothetical protein UX94_C0003G0029 [Parcubacteria group bacterium GW2011_GWA2_47_21]
MKFPFSRKTIFIALAAIVVVGGAVAYIEFKNNADVYESQSPSGLTAVERQIITRDADEDGLADWEEVLWKTNIKNADTDGDGANDAEEIKANRNPLVKGPDDKLDSATIKEISGSTDSKNLTETDKFARDFLVRYIASQDESGISDPEVFNGLIEDYLSSGNPDLSPRAYGLRDIKVTAEETAEAIRAYGNGVAGGLMRKADEKELPSELIAFDQYSRTGDLQALETLNELVARYKRMENDLVAITVPNTAVVSHLGLLNVLSGTRFSIEAMASTKNDPMKALVGLRYYSDASLIFLPAIREIKAYLSAKGVVFAQGEDGYKLFNAL